MDLSNHKRLREIRAETRRLERLAKATSSKGLNRRIERRLYALEREAAALEPRKREPER